MNSARLASVALALLMALPAHAGLLSFCEPAQEKTFESALRTAIFTEYRDNYFITGLPQAGDHPRNFVRFQLSVKYNLVPTTSRCTLYFAYTQKSLWNLWNFSGSSPFEDSNYNPAFFFAWTNQDFGTYHSVPSAGFNLLYIHTGYEHESNGRDKEASRGWERLSSTARFGWYLKGGWHLLVQPRLWVPWVSGRETEGGGNPDLIDYYGYGSLSLELGKDQHPDGYAHTVGTPAWRDFMVGVMGRAGRRFDRGYAELWARYRLPFETVSWSLYAQLVTGYGETLLRYNQKVTAFRVGIALDDRFSWNAAIR